MQYSVYSQVRGKSAVKTQKPSTFFYDKTTAHPPQAPLSQNV
jgi:hypothetical protein